MMSHLQGNSVSLCCHCERLEDNTLKKIAQPIIITSLRYCSIETVKGGQEAGRWVL